MKYNGRYPGSPAEVLGDNARESGAAAFQALWSLLRGSKKKTDQNGGIGSDQEEVPFKFHFHGLCDKRIKYFSKRAKMMRGFSLYCQWHGI